MKSIIKDSIREIKKTYKRFISIILMAMLGVAIFVGISASGDNIAHTVGRYFQKYDIYDLKLISTLGLTSEDLEDIQKLDSVTTAIATYEKDMLLELNESQYVITAMEYNETLNKVELKEGSIPSEANEVMIDVKLAEEQNIKIGDKLNLTEVLEENEEAVLKNTEVVVSGISNTPLYITEERGTSKLGTGKVDYYIYLNKENKNSEIFTTIYIASNRVDGLLIESKEYKQQIELIKSEVNSIAETRKKARYDKLVNEATEEINDAQAKLDEENKKAEDEISKAEQDIKDAENELKNAENEIASGTKKANTEFANAKKQIEENEKLLKNQKIEVENGKKQIQAQVTELKNNLTQLTTQIEQLNKTYEETKDETTKQVLKAQIEELQKAKVQIETGITQANANAIQIDQQLAKAEKELQSAKNQLQKQEKETYSQLDKAKKEVANAKIELEDGKKELEEKKQEALTKIADAQKELDEAKEEIKDIEYPKWYLWDRKEANTGYSVATQYSEILSTVSKVFPVLFFAVATLMSLNSMTRMVDEERTQIGTLKAMGYGKFQIASKYILYAALATIIGNLIGIFVGFEVLTYIIEALCLETYTNVPLGPIIYDWNLVLIGFVISTLCIVGGAIYASYRKLKYVPAKLMRPKAPKIGKRIFLEKIPFIWNKLSFTQKVTFRNMFRYKKRFLMTIIGISGATALTLVGFGVNDSTGDIVNMQYKDIFNYQITASLEETTQEEQNKMVEELQQKEEINSILPVKMQSIHINHNNETKDVQLIITSDNLEGFIDLRNIETKEKYVLDENSVVLTQRIANMLGIKEGDKIQIEDEDGIQNEVTVSKIAEQYISHYMYMSDELYEKLYSTEVKDNVFLIKTVELDKEKEEILSKALLENYKFSAINLSSDVDSVMVDFDIIVIVLILVSGILALLVLYNLSNININERIRELATLKVLGFYPKEIDSYVNKEMTLLSLIGILLGLLLGTVLTMFILEIAQLELIMFPKIITPLSYLYAFVIVLGFTFIVNIVSHFALKKIDMIESLKSVE